jgi:lipase
VSRALHVETWGDPANPRVVCLHGITGHGSGARRVAEGWLADRYVVAPDLLGHGSSPYEPPWSIDEHVRLVLEAVGDEPAAWVGHSFGARLAFEVAGRRPELVERLVLLDPAILIDPGIALLVERTAATGRTRRSRRASSGGSSRASARTRMWSRRAGFSSRTRTAAGATATARRR